MKRSTALTIVMLVTACSCVDAGVIRGVVRVSGRIAAPEQSLNAYAGRANSLPHASPSVRGRVTDAVVYVKALPDEVAAALPVDPSVPELAQVDQSFEPRVLAIAAGTTVAFPNRDPIYHNVFSLSHAKRFDLGKYAQGGSRSSRFQRPGVVTVYCDIHSNMEAFILVAPNAAFARPDVTGAFVLPTLPAGMYTLVSWHPDFGEIETNVTVPASGDTDVELLF